MSYDSYCLSNCYSVHDANPSTTDHVQPNYASWQWEDLRLIRAFDAGPEEATFILIHSEIESHTPGLIKAFDTIAAGLGHPNGFTGTVFGGAAPAAASASTPESAVAQVEAGLTQLRDSMEQIVVSQLKMFNASDPRNYERYVRPWIFGWKGNPDLPDGVVFEGVDGDAPTFLRGETGAQSTIVPSLDIVCGITHRNDRLRDMLAELEAYRPEPQRRWLAGLRTIFYGQDAGAGLAAVDAATSSGDKPPAHLLRDFIAAAGPDSARLDALLTACISLVWAFRDIHVTFSQLYIGMFSNKENATGGTPYKAYLRKHRVRTAC
jgi:indoleamine 2,3-dioxygenase